VSRPRVVRPDARLRAAGRTPALEGFVAANLSPEALFEHQLDLLCVVDRKGRVHWRELRNWRTKHEFTLKVLPREQLAEDHPGSSTPTSRAASKMEFRGASWPASSRPRPSSTGR
jgi:hypothetical protein